MMPCYLMSAHALLLQSCVAAMCLCRGTSLCTRRYIHSPPLSPSSPSLLFLSYPRLYSSLFLLQCFLYFMKYISWITSFNTPSIHSYLLYFLNAACSCLSLPLLPSFSPLSSSSFLLLLLFLFCSSEGRGPLGNSNILGTLDLSWNQSWRRVVRTLDLLDTVK